MQQGLFESITGKFKDGTDIDALPLQSRRLQSVMDYLARLFNTREGSIPHLPDYGLPDISEIYRKMPHGIEELQAAIKRTIDRYEPRLKNIKVMHLVDELDKFKLLFIISGELTGSGVAGQRVRFQTAFTSMGNSSITAYKRSE